MDQLYVWELRAGRASFCAKREYGKLEQGLYIGKVSKAKGPSFHQTLEQRGFPGARDQ